MSATGNTPDPTAGLPATELETALIQRDEARKQVRQLHEALGRVVGWHDRDPAVLETINEEALARDDHPSLERDVLAHARLVLAATKPKS